MRIGATPSSPFSFRLILNCDGTRVGAVAHRLWGRPGVLEVGETVSSIVRAGSRRWRLDGAATPVTAEPAGTFRTSYSVDWPGGSILAERIGLGYGVRLVRDGQEVGRIRPRNPFVRSLVAIVADDLPIEVVGMVIYLVMRMRRRAAVASGGA